MKRNISSADAPHLSERVFRKYEGHIARVVSLFPTPVVFDPGDLAGTTFASQFRSAIGGVLLNNYSTEINLNRLNEIWSQSHVVVRGDHVVVQPKTAVLPVNEVTASESRYLFDLTTPTIEQLSAIASVYLTRLTEKPTRVVAPPPWTPPPGITLARQPDNSFLIL